MSDKLPTIQIQGKEYVLVKDRVSYFNKQYPNGSIYTELVSEPNDERIIVQAIVTPDHDQPNRFFADYSQEVVGGSMINKTSALENASTSAIGRALALMGIGVEDSIASADEVVKATQNAPQGDTPITQPQANTLRGMMVSRGIKTAGDAQAFFKSKGFETTTVDELTKSQASTLIDYIGSKTADELQEEILNEA